MLFLTLGNRDGGDQIFDSSTPNLINVLRLDVSPHNFTKHLEREWERVRERKKKRRKRGRGRKTERIS